jgi:PAS domain S-box-containing protein
LDLLSLAECKSRLAAIVDSSNDAIISKNLQGVISTWNRAAQDLFGYSEAEAVGQPITIIIPPDLQEEENHILSRVRSGARVDHYETRRLARDGRTLDVSITVSPVRDAAGAIVGASKILRDVTESKRAHLALQESKEQMASEVAAERTLQAISTRLISESDQACLFEQLLDAAMELMSSDFSSIQMLAPDGKSLTLIGWRNFHPTSAAHWHRVTTDGGCACGRALRDGARVLIPDVESCEFLAGTQDMVEYRRSEIQAVQSTPLRSRSGHPLGMLSTHWRTPHTPTEDKFRLFDVLARQAADIIERIRAEEALRESEERFRIMANTAPVIIWMSDVDKRCVYVNETGLSLTGQSPETVLGLGWMDRVHPDDITQCWNVFAGAFDRREHVQIVFRLRNKDGEYRWMVSTGAPRYHVDGSFAGYIGSGIDFTERKQAEEALATINQQLVDAQEGERRRIARELHDDISQRLAMLTMRLDMLAAMSTAPAASLLQATEEARVEARSLAKDVQTLSHRMHPGHLEYLGIAAAATALCQEISKQRDLEITFTAAGVPEGLSRNVAVCLYRVLQEALQNAIKYSQTRKIEASLRGGVDQIELTIRDFGVGFNTEKPADGLGLTSMKERVRAISGRLSITSEPQRGTTVVAIVPVGEGELKMGKSATV